MSKFVCGFELSAFTAQEAAHKFQYDTEADVSTDIYCVPKNGIDVNLAGVLTALAITIALFIGMSLRKS